MQKIIFKIVKKIFLKFCYFLQIELPIKYFGTIYGGWYISEKHISNYPIILSAGVGEDISFDIEMINNFKAYIFFIDPTPRAISHIEEVINNLGKKKKVEFDENSGLQNVRSYDLHNINITDFLLIKKALYDKSNLSIKFFKPRNHLFVSHSISNYQNQFKKNSDFIEVETITIEDISYKHKIKNIDILKLDIEGAENQVIPNFLKRNIFPKQLLVEFDELSTEFIRPYLKAIIIFLKLTFNSYKLVKTENFPNFLFIREKI